MVLLVALTVCIAFLRSKDDAAKQRVLLILAFGIFCLELARRVINLSKGGPYDLDTLLYILLPRPWCAISCWLTMAAALSRKRLLCNFSAMNGLLCALVFFVYPNVGFNHRVILFENFYSIATHSLLLVSSISMMTLGFTDFRLDKGEILKTVGLLAAVYLYATAEILLGIEDDPLFFMPSSEVQDFLGVEYPIFLVIYTVFLIVYFSAFYLIQHLAHGKASHRDAQA